MSGEWWLIVIIDLKVENDVEKHKLRDQMDVSVWPVMHGIFSMHESLQKALELC